MAPSCQARSPGKRQCVSWTRIQEHGWQMSQGPRGRLKNEEVNVAAAHLCPAAMYFAHPSVGESVKRIRQEGESRWRQRFWSSGGCLNHVRASPFFVPWGCKRPLSTQHFRRTHSRALREPWGKEVCRHGLGGYTHSERLQAPQHQPLSPSPHELIQRTSTEGKCPRGQGNLYFAEKGERTERSFSSLLPRCRNAGIY